jgi:hypothetical protein
MFLTLISKGCSKKLITKYKNATWSMSSKELTHYVFICILITAIRRSVESCNFLLFFSPTVVYDSFFNIGGKV